MFDLILRALKHPIDYLGFWRVTDLPLIEIVRESEGVFSFIFVAKNLPTWKAGQHAIFTLPNRKVFGKTWKAFSIASAPSEGVIRIGTNIVPEPSSFKQQLLSLHPGDKIRMHGPFGELYQRPNMRRMVAVVGGIGITPIRSMIAKMAQEKSQDHLHLIYSASGEHTYKNDLEKWKESLPNLKITYVSTPEEVNQELSKEIASQGNNAYYLLSGAPKMIEALRRALRARLIRGKQILNDPFKGY